jgi:hypothetical protein
MQTSRQLAARHADVAFLAEPHGQSRKGLVSQPDLSSIPLESWHLFYFFRTYVVPFPFSFCFYQYTLQAFSVVSTLA